MKKATILFGAGAAMPWSAPSTEDLTQCLCTDTAFISKTGKRFGDVLFEILSTYYQGDVGSINFEMLLNCVEILFEYNWHKGLSNPLQLRPPYPSLFEMVREIQDEIPRFKILTSGDQLVYGYFENCDLDEFSERTPSNCDGRIINGLFFKLLYQRWIERIFEKVRMYEENFYDANNQYSRKLIEFLKELKRKEYTLRLYSINYDTFIYRLPTGIQFFDGFKDLPANGEGEVDVKRILLDTISDCFFNLHGSIYYRFISTGSVIEGKFVCNRKEPQYPSFGMMNIANGSQNLISNIVAGYDKINKTSLEPMRSFQSAFTLDCLSSALLIIIGFSFSDFHLISTIRRCLSENRGLKVIVVAKYPDEVKTVTWENNKLFHLQADSFELNPPIQNNGWAISADGLKGYFSKGFEEFLNTSAWTEFIDSVEFNSLY